MEMKERARMSLGGVMLVSVQERRFHEGDYERQGQKDGAEGPHCT